MEIKEKKVKISTLVFTIVIFLLIIVVICLYFNAGGKITANKEIENMNLNITQDEIENDLVLNCENSKTEENINSTNNIETNGIIPQENKYDLQYINETIMLNGKKHVCEVKYSSDMTLTYEEGEFYDSDAVILLDNKVVKKITINYFGKDRTKDDVKISTMRQKYGIDKKEYLVISIDAKIGYTGTEEHTFYIINEEGEIIEKVNFGKGANVYIDGKKVTYELKEDSLIWYEYNYSEEQEQDIKVVKFQMYLGNDESCFRVLRTYKDSEVVLSGKV